MKILLGDFNVKVGKEYFLSQQLGMRVYTIFNSIQFNSIQFNSLFIYVLSSTAGGQLQSQQGKQIQHTEQNTHNENKIRKK
jgi:hypothetical protein